MPLSFASSARSRLAALIGSVPGSSTTLIDASLESFLSAMKTDPPPPISVEYVPKLGRRRMTPSTRRAASDVS